MILVLLQLESAQAENEQLKDRVEELSLDLEILKNEISEGGKNREVLHHYDARRFVTPVILSVIIPWPLWTTILAQKLWDTLWKRRIPEIFT